MKKSRPKPWFFGAAALRGGLLAAQLGVIAACGSGAGPAVGTTAGRAPDVLLITVDTLRADALGAYGHRGGATPWMDRLAGAGVRFETARAQTVLTLPSHANILSARYPFAHGVRDNAGFRFPVAIDTLPVWLRARGYRTGAFVSAFPLDARFGLARGFDVYDDRLAGTPRPAFLEQERAGPDTIARALAWLGSGDTKPSFCWVHLYEPHYPYAPPEPFASRFAGDPYEGEVAAADAALAPLLAAILDGPRRDSTIVILTGDHGESLGEHGEATHGIFAYEATLRVPLILYAPAMMTPAVRRDAVRHVDLAPTVLDLIGAPSPADLDGRSLRAAAGTGAPETYFEALSGALHRGWAPVRGVIRGGLKYVDVPIPELYDLAADPGEARNLADARPSDVRTLHGALHAFPQTAARARPESADAGARLGSLGYVSGGAPLRTNYTEADDPKRLIEADRGLQDVVARYTGGDAIGARDAARALADRHPRMTVAWLQLASLERDTGRLRAGVEALERARAIDPESAQVAALLGAYLTQEGRADEAVAVLTPFAARAEPDVEILRALAIATARRGGTDRAIALLRRARELDPGEAQLLVDEGTIALMADRRADARAAFEHAVERDPGLARAHSSLAALAADEGRADEAARHWRAAVDRDPSEYGRVFALAVAHARGGRLPQARAAFEFFAASAPPARFAAEIAQARAWLSRSR